ncbi:MAG: hypothetical protein ACI4I9_08920 [Porcipelethomonas sp.]
MRFFKEKALSILLSAAIAVNLLPARASAYSNYLNIKVFLASNEFTVYDLPYAYNTRFQMIDSTVNSFFYVVAGINVDLHSGLSNEYIKTTILEDCSNYNVNRMNLICDHWSNSECNNSSPSMPSIKHHTNVYNVMNQIPNATSNYAVMLLTPNRLCSRKSTTHKNIIGATWSASNRLIVSDMDYVHFKDYAETFSKSRTEYGRYNMVHEIGHLFGVGDHYDRSYGEDKDNCIWGINRFDYEIYSKLKICSDCQQTLNANKYKYNHTPIS